MRKNGWERWIEKIERERKLMSENDRERIEKEWKRKCDERDERKWIRGKWREKIEEREGKRVMREMKRDNGKSLMRENECDEC